MRKGNNSLIHTMTHIQRMNARRDLVVLFRICVLLGILLVSSIPGAMAVVISFVFGYTPWWSSEITLLFFTLSTPVVAVVLLVTSPHVLNLWKKHFHLHRPTAITAATVRVD